MEPWQERVNAAIDAIEDVRHQLLLALTQVPAQDHDLNLSLTGCDDQLRQIARVLRRRIRQEEPAMHEQSQTVAQRAWHTRDRVRIREDAASRSVDPPGERHFRAGEEVVLIQWGHCGYPVMRDSWWDSMDVDGAHIIDATKVDVIAVLDEVLPG